MKRILILAIMGVLMAGCSDDDGGSGKKLYLKSLLLLNPSGANSELTFTYNEDKQLASIVTSDATFNIEYADNRPASITPVGGNGNSTYELSYEGGILSSVKEDGTAYDVVYNSAARKYTIAGMEREFELTKDNDISVIRDLGVSSSVTPFTYSGKNKGAFHSLDTDYTFMILYLLNTPYFASVMPLASYGIYTLNNTFNSDGYITRADFMQGNDLLLSFTYEYQEL